MNLNLCVHFSKPLELNFEVILIHVHVLKDLG